MTETIMNDTVRDRMIAALVADLGTTPEVACPECGATIRARMAERAD
jgi:hypothetical protein